ncbi:hypothetical protein [Metallosphaera yellowstonensis]|nr:hypothetical protein [Metallosphaera yellowstonensis]
MEVFSKHTITYILLSRLKDLGDSNIRFKFQDQREVLGIPHGLTRSPRLLGYTQTAMSISEFDVIIMGVWVPFIQVDNDPDVDVIVSDGEVNVYLDLRTAEVRASDLMFKADEHSLYVYDPRRKVVIKVVRLPVEVVSDSIQFQVRNGTVTVTMRRK